MFVNSNNNILRCRFLCKSSFLMWSTRFYRGGNKNKNNVGIKNRLKLFSAENPEIDQLNIDDASFDEFETELTSGKQIVDLHKRNIEVLKKKVDLKIIERKYFEKIKIPNFLMWAEKEQIRKLHMDDPDFWTYDKLSQSFPATPDIIKKIIKSAWKPEDTKRIVKHDQQVKNNWEKLKKGNIQTDSVLKQHLSTFSSRRTLQHFNDNDYIRKKKLLPDRGSEFTKIILDYQERTLKPLENRLLKGEDTNINKIDFDNKLPSSEIRYPQKPFVKKMTTLEQLRKTVKESKIPTEYSEQDKAFLKEENNEPNFVTAGDQEQLPYKEVNNKYSIKAVAPTAQESIPMKIQVPKKLPKTSVYKVNDVYYDVDGTFLYRVPGMK